MTGLEWIAQVLLSGVFLVDGLSRVLTLRPSNRLAVQRRLYGIRLAPELTAIMVAAEIAGALALWVPASFWPPDILPRLPATMLALLAVAGGVYHLRRREPAAPNVALFLLALFVILGRW